MNLTLQNTGDGSNTIYSEAFKETYHSVNGAVTESMHVFINAGFKMYKQDPLHILEIGFGTGLNAVLTLMEAQKDNIVVEYQSIELFPLENIMVQSLGYGEFLSSEKNMFQALHDAPWNGKVDITPWFQLHKIKTDLLTFNFSDPYDVVYFDAFSPVTQPELWTEEVFEKLFNHMNNGGILTTYCAKGIVRRTLQKVGFKTERLPGPPGKREMLRATK